MRAKNNNLPVSFSEKMSKKILFNLFAQITCGVLYIQDKQGHYQFGDKAKTSGLTASIEIKRSSTYRAILLGGSLGAGKSYIAGDWDTDDLQQLITLFIKNEALFKQIESPMAQFLSFLRTIAYQAKLNSITRAKKNILAHYDLGNDFFKLILDPSMMYSCAIYASPMMNLADASKNKLNTICHALNLKPSDHILEIGTGWGGFACFAAQNFGCRVTTTTISEKQYAYVKEKISQLGLTEQITLLKSDYRKLSGQYDKIVSIEMIEAVGYRYFDTFFRQCNALLKSGGLFFLQAIVINDKAYQKAKKEVDFIKQYIFPGSCLPSVASITQSVAKHTNLHLLSLKDIGAHYVSTLNDWHQRLIDNKTAIQNQGFNEDFFRMWAFYFCYCAAGFQTQHISDIHVLWQKKS